MFSDLKRVNNPATSGSPVTCSTGSFIASGEVVISGSSFVEAPATGSMMPAVAIAIWRRLAVTTSSWLSSAPFRLR